MQPYGQRIRNEAAAADNTRWYTGHPQDPETGLVYAGARYYDPVIGRFMAIDPQPFLENDPFTFNQYAYANNNPYRYIDPDGRSVLAIEGAKAGFFGGTIVCGPICGGIAGVVGFAGGLYLTDKAWDYIHASSDESSASNTSGDAEGSQAERPAGIPDNWVEQPTEGRGGRQWVNPDNPHDRVRSMPGDPNSSNPGQREPYVRDVRNGNQWLDKFGNRVEGREGRNSPDTHIPTKDYKFPK